MTRRKHPPASTARFLSRFWSRVDDSGGGDACWKWRGTRGGRYGVFRLSRNAGAIGAHVLAITLTGASVRGRDKVVHRCGVPDCCNPAHLVIGRHGYGRWPTVSSARTLERFWSKVDDSGGPDACWPWRAHTDAANYGLFTLSRTRFGSTKAHRVALMFSGVMVPDGKFVLHACDVPICCNPRHLRVGDHQENMRDRKARGRYAPRETWGQTA